MASLLSILLISFIILTISVWFQPSSDSFLALLMCGIEYIWLLSLAKWSHTQNLNCHICTIKIICGNVCITHFFFMNIPRYEENPKRKKVKVFHHSLSDAVLFFLYVLHFRSFIMMMPTFLNFETCFVAPHLHDHITSKTGFNTTKSLPLVILHLSKHQQN